MNDTEKIIRALEQESTRTRKTIVVCSTVLALILIACFIPALGILALAFAALVIVAGTIGYLLAKAANKSRDLMIDLENKHPNKAIDPTAQ